MSFTQQDPAVDESLVSFLDGIEFTSGGGVVYRSKKDAPGALCSSDFSDFSSTCSNGSPYSGSTEFSSADSDDSLSSLLFSSQLGGDDGDSALGFEFTACDWDMSSPVLPPLSVQPLEPQQQQIQQQEGKPQRKKAPARAKKGAVAGTTMTETPVPAAMTKRPRKHNRIEIIKLREQVEELQARQAKLQKFRSDRSLQLQQDKSVSVSVSVAVAAQQGTQGGTKMRKTANGTTSVNTAIVAASPRSVWFALAVQQYRGLQESEALNRKLRDAVAKQLKVTNSFQALLQKKTSSQDLDLLLEIPQPVASAIQSQLQSPEEQKLTELCASMERQFLETDLVCHRLATTNDITSVFSTSQAKQDAVCGPMFELMTNTPVANSFQLLASTMWSRIIEKKGLPVVTPPPSRRGPKTPSLLAFHDKQVQMSMTSRLGDLHVEGVMAISKFEEPHRSVIAIASTYTVSGSCVVLREHAWIIVSDTATRLNDEATGTSALWGKPSQSALFQTFYRLLSEKKDAASATGSSPFAEKEELDEETSYVQELVMKNLSDKMRQHMTQLQTSLLSEISGLSSYMGEVKCPLIECGC
ncbi:hypothetical protein Gpo141_00008227 [Globisporangium polare]